MSKRTEFGIIVNEEHQFILWPTHHVLPLGWRFTGLRGTQAEMAELLLEQFVETTPGTHSTPDSHFSASQWADTPFGASSQWQDTPFGASQ